MDSDGNITNYEWDFGDGSNGVGEITTHVYLFAGNYIVILRVTDDDGAQDSIFKILVVSDILDTGPSAKLYPSIAGCHNGTIKPSNNLIITKLYTYPCEGTGGHTEYAAISYPNGTVLAEAYWNGYVGDWHNISFNNSFTLYANQTYNYTIRTGSYPQIIHAHECNVTGGVITCTDFMDVNGKRYNDWIPAIKLY